MSELYGKIIITSAILALCVCGIGVGTIHSRLWQRICNTAVIVLAVVCVGAIMLAIWS